MNVALAARAVHRIRGVSRLWLYGALLCGVSVADVRAGFVDYYAPDHFTLINYGGGADAGGLRTANGFATFPDLNTLILTGTNDGSGVEGWTDLTIPAARTGWLRFHYSFATQDLPEFEYGGYLVGSEFFPLADSDGAFGWMNVSVDAGELFGFRAGSVDSQAGYRGVLTITDFGPVPEPGTLYLLAVSGAVAAAGKAWASYRRKASS